MPDFEEILLPPEEELTEEFVRSAAGPGGQKVNKTSSSVRLVWRFADSTFLPPEALEKLKRLTGETEEIAILAREHRSLLLNREAARARLSVLLQTALKKEKKRKKTKPTRASKERRLKAKSIRSQVKSGRSGRDFDE